MPEPWDLVSLGVDALPGSLQAHQDGKTKLGFFDSTSLAIDGEIKGL